MSSEVAVVVNPADTEIVVQPQVAMVLVAAPGPPGPAGPQGPTGAAGGDPFIYDRNGVPAQIWTIPHNRNRLVAITVLLDSGEEVSPDVAQLDANTAVVTFAVPTSGKALVL